MNGSAVNHAPQMERGCVQPKRKELEKSATHDCPAGNAFLCAAAEDSRAPRERNRFAIISKASRAFTLIEIMIVVAIMGIVLTMGVPIVYRMWHKEAMISAVRDLQAICSNARANAILRGAMTELIFHPKERRVELSGAPAANSDAGAVAAPSGGASVQLADSVQFEMLDVNLSEYKDEDTARVRFYPNGTCDEMTVILVDDKNQRREITLEVTTALVNVVSEVSKFR